MVFHYPNTKSALLPIQLLEGGIIEDSNTVILIRFCAHVLCPPDTSHKIRASSFVVTNPPRGHSQLVRRNMKLLYVIDHSQTEGVVVGHAEGRGGIAVRGGGGKQEGGPEGRRHVGGDVPRGSA